VKTTESPDDGQIRFRFPACRFTQTAKTATTAGGAAIVGIGNIYNQRPITLASMDSTSSWTYATATWRLANGSASNVLTYVDSAASVSVQGFYQIMADTSSGADAVSGLVRNWVSATPSGNVGAVESTTSAPITALRANNSWFPSAVGVNTISAPEDSLGASTVTFRGVFDFQQMNLSATIQY
jgi:hypothetical protein